MVMALTPFEALRLAVERANGQSGLARICGVSQTAVWKWLQSSKRMPAEYVLRAEAATGVPRYCLRPDIYPRGDMVDQAAPLRFVGLDRRASSRADRLALGERYAQAE